MISIIPTKQRVTLHSSSCNRRILVYDLVYAFIRTQSTHGDCSLWALGALTVKHSWPAFPLEPRRESLSGPMDCQLDGWIVERNASVWLSQSLCAHTVTGGASAMAPYGVTVYVPDQRLGNGNRKLGTYITPKSLLWLFYKARGEIGLMYDYCTIGIHKRVVKGYVLSDPVCGRDSYWRAWPNRTYYR